MDQLLVWADAPYPRLAIFNIGSVSGRYDRVFWALVGLGCKIFEFYLDL